MPLFKVPYTFEAMYRRAITMLMVREIPQDLFADSASDWLSKVAALSDDSYFLLEAERVARTLIKAILVQNVFEWRDLARKTIGGGMVTSHLNELNGLNLRETLNSEIGLIKEGISSIPRRVSKTLNEIIRGMDQDSGKTSSLLKKRYPSVLNQKVAMIAQTDPHRLNSMISKARCEDLGFPCFIWTTSKDKIVRPTHLLMDGVVVFWAHLPDPESLNSLVSVHNRYVPGGIENCRCGAIPVISIDSLFIDRSSVRVYFRDKIRHMTKIQLMDAIVGETYATVA